MMQRIFNKVMVFLLVFTQVLMATTAVAYAEGGRDITKEILDTFTVEAPEGGKIVNGSEVKVNATFSDKSFRISEGDYLKVQWESVGDAVEMSGAGGQTDLIIKDNDGNMINVGVAVITYDSATITFNKNIENFSVGSIAGAFNFNASFRVSKEADSNQSITVSGSAVDIPIHVEVEPPKDQGDTGVVPGEVGYFANKTGSIFNDNKDQPELSKMVVWNIDLNPNKLDLVGDIVVNDTIEGNKVIHELDESSLSISVTDRQGTQEFYRADMSEEFTIESFKYKYNARVEYDDASGKLYVLIPSGNATQKSFVLGYNTLRTNPNASGESYRNSVEVNYQVWNEDPSSFNKEVVTVSSSMGATITGAQPGKAIFVKKDSVTKAVLPGVEFRVLDENKQPLDKIFTSDEKGQVIIDLVKEGLTGSTTYYLEEVKALDGYELMAEPIEFNVSKEGYYNDQVFNTPIPDEPKGSLKIIKKTSVKDVKEPFLKGAEFKLSKADNEGNATEVVAENIVTDDNGEFLVAELDLGTYVLEETKAPKNYKLDNKKHVVTITENEETNNVTTATITNEPIQPLIPLEPSKPLGSLKIVKTSNGEDNKGAVLPGAKFKLTSVATKDGKPVFSATDIETDNNGEAVIKGLSMGEYLLVETEAPEGYVLSDKEYNIVIEENKETAHQTVARIENAPVILLGDLEITKVNALTGHLLKGAEFSLTSTKDSKQSFVTVSDEEGKAYFKDIPVGTYELVETKAPRGFNEDKTPRTIEIVENRDGQATVKETVLNVPTIPLIPLEPSKAVGSLKVNKINGSTGHLLEGAEFKLVSHVTGEEFTATTDETGSVLFSGLALGTYELTETKAPLGFKLDSLPQEVEIVKDVIAEGDVSIPGLQITVANEPVEPLIPLEPSTPLGSLQVNKVNGITGHLLPGATFKLTSHATGEEFTATTDATGSLVFNGMALGTYELIETKAPTGFKLDTLPQTVEIVKDVVVDETTSIPGLQVTVANEPDMPLIPLEPATPVGGLKVTKINTITGHVLSDATFKLVSKATGEEFTGTTNAAGELIFGQLELGDYELKETQAPKGFILDKQGYNVEVKENKETNNVSMITVGNMPEVPLIPIVPSTPIGSIELIKVDTETREVLAGAAFKLVSEATGKTYEVTTDATGKAVLEGLPLGTYALQETKAPEGYVLDNTVKMIEVIESKALSNRTYVTVENEAHVPIIPIEPSRAIGGVTLHKVDSVTGRSLAGAEFELIEVKTGDRYPLVTDSSGTAIVRALELGSYELRETKAPKGYLLDATVRPIEIVVNDETLHTVELTVENEPDPTERTEPDIYEKDPKPDPKDPQDPQDPKPDPKDPQDPQDPKQDPKPEPTEKTESDTKQGKPKERTKGDRVEGRRLPQTGEKSTSLTMIGLVMTMMVGTLAGVMIYRKR